MEVERKDRGSLERDGVFSRLGVVEGNWCIKPSGLPITLLLRIKLRFVQDKACV